DKVVTATQSADAQHCPAHVDMLSAGQFFQFNFLGIGMFGTPDVKPCRNFVIYDSVQLFQVDFAFVQQDSCHTAADIYSHQVGYDFVPDRHRGPYGTSGTGVCIRHDPDPAASDELLVAQFPDLIDCRAVDIVSEYFSC